MFGTSYESAKKYETVEELVQAKQAAVQRWSDLKKDNSYKEFEALSRPAVLKMIIDDLECSLSPENLTCDGERSSKEVQRLGKILQHNLRLAESE